MGGGAVLHYVRLSKVIGVNVCLAVALVFIVEQPVLAGTAPDQFFFTDQTGIQLSSSIESDIIVVTGIDGASPIAITGGEYSISSDGGQTWSEFSAITPSTVNLNDRVKVRQTSSGSYYTRTDAILTIGGVSGTFSVTTAWSSSCSAVPNGIVSWWKGEGNAADVMGVSNATVQGGAAFAEGRVGQAFSFNGVDQYVEENSPPSALNIGTQSWTIAAWVQTSYAGASAQEIVSRYACGWNCQQNNAGAALYELNLDETGRAQFSVRSTPHTQGFTATDTLDIRDGKWHFVAGVLDRAVSEIRIIVDGHVRTTVSSAGLEEISDVGSPLEIGRQFKQGWGSPGNYFNGLIDEVAIFNRELSAQEIYSTYVSGMGGICLDLVPDQFSFEPVNNASVNQVVEYNLGSITGIDGSSPISVNCPGTVCEYAVYGKAWGDWTAAAGFINPGDQVKVRITASNGIGVRTVTLAIGGVTADFNVTVPAIDVSGTITPAEKGAIDCPGQVGMGANVSCAISATAAGWYIEQVVDGGTTVNLTVHPLSYQYDIPGVQSAHTVNATLNEFLVKGMAGQATSYYDQPDAACTDVLATNDQILLRAWPGIYNPLTVDHTGSLLLGGGYGTGFISVPGGLSTLGAPLIINGGPVQIDGIAIQ